MKFKHIDATVEPVFGNLRYDKGLDRFTLRGQAKVNTRSIRGGIRSAWCKTFKSWRITDTEGDEEKPFTAGLFRPVAAQYLPCIEKMRHTERMNQKSNQRCKYPMHLLALRGQDGVFIQLR